MDKKNKEREEITEVCVTGGTGITTTKKYHIGNIKYLGIYSNWIKTTIEDYEDFWDIYLDEEMNMQYSTEVELLGSGTANGKDCWVIKEESDISAMNNANSITPEMLEEMLKEENISESEFEEFNNMLSKIEITTKIWVTKDNYLPLVTLTTKKIEGMETKDVVEASDFNKPLSIKLPNEADNAVEYPG